MNPKDWLERLFLSKTKQKRPDGRPLYAYKCTDNDYEDLSSFLRGELQQIKRGVEPFLFKPLFCFYAAETWRRKHEGGPWKWETIFSGVCQWIPNYPKIYDWVKGGLIYWDRPILKSQNGDKEYLITIACEGGLPLLLLRKQNAPLYRYFKNLLESYHRERQLPACDVTTIARRLAIHLPASLRYDIVYNLGGELVRKVVDLQEQVTDAVDPITALDRYRPNWRDDLPLPLVDSTVELLLKNLVNEARILAVTERQRVHWRRLLVQKGNEWTIEKRLEMPNIFTGAVLQKWTNREDILPRLRILLKTPREIEPIALITRLRGEGESANYRCEILKRTEVRLSGKKALADLRLLVSDGITESELPIAGGEEWGPLPWIFGERDGQWEFLREGSTRCRDHTVRVLLPLNGRCETDAGECKSIADVPDLDRELCQISGTVLWHHSELGSCRIQCASLDATEDVLLLKGRRLPGVADQTPPFLGMPDLYAVDPKGTWRLLNDVPLEWRPCGGVDAEWSQNRKSCAGEVWIRCTEQNGDQRFRRRVRIAPANMQITIAQIGLKEKPGRLHLTGLAGAQVCCIETPRCTFHHRHLEDGFEIMCFSDAGLPVTEFPVKLLWPDGRFLDLQLPFPRGGGAFVCAGEVLPAGERVPVARMATIQAVAQAPAGGQWFDLMVNIKTQTRQWHHMWFREHLTFENDGRSIFYLHRLQERIASLLSSTGELDSLANLEIIQQTNHCLARLEVGQFDITMEPDRENSRIAIPRICQSRLEDGWEQRVALRMVRLWAPSTEPLFLCRSSSDIAWEIPENLEPGPWWILGEDGDWARFRPLLWHVQGEAEIGDSPLEKAIRQTDKDAREEMLRHWVDQISMNPEHSDWPRFFELLRLIRPYPACALDLFRYVVKSPEAMVLVLLQSFDDDFEAVWSLAYQLQFSWYLLPVRAWLSSGQRYFSALQLGLSKVESGGEILWQQFQAFRERVINRRPFFRQICDWMCLMLFPEKPRQNSELAIGQSHPEIIVGLIKEEEQKFQARHDTEEKYPEGPQVMRVTEDPDYQKDYDYHHLAEPFRPVRCAPFVAAHISVRGIEYDDILLVELKNLRDFDREWFNAAYASALCLALGQRLRKECGVLA